MCQIIHYLFLLKLRKLKRLLVLCDCVCEWGKKGSRDELEVEPSIYLASEGVANLWLTRRSFLNLFDLES